MFWSDLTEPLRKNRWKIIFGFAGLSGYTAYLKKVDKPSYKTTDITHKFGNYSFYYPGRVEWNPITISFAATKVLSDNIKLLFSEDYLDVPGPATEALALQGVSKTKFVNSLNGVKIVQLDSTGGASLETWDLVNPFFTNIKWGDLSYESEEIIDVEITVRYDSAIYEIGDSQEN